MKKFTTSEMFRGKYLKNLPSDFVWQKTPLQIYPLSSMSDYFLLPTPLLKTDYNFMIYILEGSFLQQIGTEKITVEAPAVVFVSAGTITSMNAIYNKMKGYFILMEDKTLFSILKNDSSLNLFTVSPVLNIDRDTDQWIYQLCKLLYKELTDRKPDATVAQGLLQALLHKILVLSGAERPLSRTQQIAIRFKQLVHVHYRQHKGTAFYANQLGVSENYLNRCVKTVFYKNAKETILEIAVLYSQLLIWDFSKSVADVCYEVNFDDPSYFSRLFKKITGKSPTAFRQSIMHDLS